jgi:hypothetical protein
VAFGACVWPGEWGWHARHMPMGAGFMGVLATRSMCFWHLVGAWGLRAGLRAGRWVGVGDGVGGWGLGLRVGG